MAIFHWVLETCRAIPNPLGEASTLHRLGDAYRQMRQYERAVGCYLEALGIRQRLGALRGQGAARTDLAALYLETGRYEMALDQCREALAIQHRTHEDAARCDTLLTKADAQRELGMPADALMDARQAVALSREIADPERQAHALVVLAAALTATGEGTGAQRACDEAARLLAGVHKPELHRLEERLRGVSAALGARRGHGGGV